MFTNYNKDIRKDIQTGDLFFTASPALFSRIIRRFTQSKVSHVGIFIRINERLFAVEALEGRGVRMIPASNRFRKERFWHVKTGYSATKELEDRILNNIGSDYDMAGAVLALFVDTKSQRNFCSELVTKVLQLNFSHLERGVFPSDVLTKFNK